MHSFHWVIDILCMLQLLLKLTCLWHVIRPGLAISPVVPLSHWIINQSETLF
jgi:hypothetical protein